MSFAIEIFPKETVVAPVYVLSADRVSVELLVDFSTVPAPEITPDSVWLADDANVKLPAFEMAPP